MVEAGVDGVEVNVFSCEGGCDGDVDGSGEVDFDDVLLILAAWGPCDEDCPVRIRTTTTTSTSTIC